MRRLRFDRFGLDALRLEDALQPAIVPSQASVRVKAARLNPSDLTNVKGGFAQTTLPRTPGRDYAGLVEEGPKDWLGAEVWGSGAELGFTEDGTHAEYVVVQAASLARKPANLGFAASAAAGVRFIAAYAALLETVGLREGETALIIGAAGSVGRAALQLVKIHKARAIGVDREAGEIHGMEVIASGSDVAAAARDRTGGRGVDVCLDAVGGLMFQAALASLANGGRLAVIAAAKSDPNVTFNMRDFYHRQLRLLGVDTLQKSAVASAAIHRELSPLFESGALTVDAPEEITLHEAVDAYRKLEAGSKRKMAIVM
jgi:NADPH:quinone reductase-like Zn-dependent oxidoreductase